MSRRLVQVVPNEATATRSIKFRAWVKTRNQMLDVLCACRDGNITVVTIETTDGVTPYEDLQILTADQFELMQFTGLLDKNGKEIYEGDIVRFHLGPLVNETFSVEWQGCGFRAHHKGTGGYQHNMPLSDEDRIEVIGNIYENPYGDKGAHL